MVDAIHAGKLRSMYLCGEEMSIVDSNANYVAEAFRKLEFFVVQDIFFSATCQFADVVLPASPSLEKEGTFTSTERRVQRLYQVFEPLPGSRPDWVIIQDVANRLGAGWNYRHPSEVMDEVAALTPMFAGVNYQRLEGYKSLQWPVAADGTDQPLLYTKSFTFPDGKARLYPLAWREPQERRDAEFDLHLNNGRLLEHFHEGNLTYRSPGIHEKTPDTFVEVSPELARSRGIESGSLVQLTSRHGRVRVRALVTDRVQDGELYMPMNSTTSPVNLLTGSHTDPATHTPAYKETAVRMEVLARHGESPLPRINHRFGHPTPQNGVEVERKWRQPGYRFPGELVQIETKAGGIDSHGTTDSIHPDARARGRLRGTPGRAALDKHTDAIVSALELLQLLHDRGVLDLLRGLVGAGDQLVGMLTAAAGYSRIPPRDAQFHPVDEVLRQHPAGGPGQPGSHRRRKEPNARKRTGRPGLFATAAASGQREQPPCDGGHARSAGKRGEGPVNAAVVTVPIGRVEGFAASRADDLLAVEEALEIRLGNRSLTITMRTPGNDFELAAGFLHSEGLIRDPSQIRSHRAPERR